MPKMTHAWHTRADTSAQLQQARWTDSRGVFRDGGGAECTQEALELEDPFSQLTDTTTFI